MKILLCAINTADILDAIFAANDFSFGAEGTLVIPFGDYPVTGRCNGKPEYMIQRFDADAVKALNESLEADRTKHGAGFRGAPVYVGHPDDPDWAKRPENHPLDRRAHGWFSSINAEGDKAVLAPKWADDGDKLRQNFAWHSPNWDLTFVAKNDKGVRIVRPSRFKSTGLTNSPNIPAAAVNEAVASEISPSNDAGAKNPTISTGGPHMDPRLAFVIALLALNEKATEDEFKAAVNAKIAAINEAQSGRATAEGELSRKQIQFAKVKKDLELQLAASNDSAKAERKSRAELAVATAINEGRVTLAEKDATIEKLVASNDGAEFEVVSKLPKKVKTESKTGRLPHITSVNDAQSDSGKKFADLVATRMREKGEDYTTAWNEAKRTPEGMMLIESMAPKN